jgi:hypothetical protein
MLRRFAGASLVLFVLGGFVLAETYRGLVTSLSKDEVKVKVFKKGEKKAEEKTFKVDKSVKFAKRGKTKEDEPTTLTADEAGKLVEKAAKSEGRFKGAFATIETSGSDDAEKVTKITFSGGFRGKGKEKRKPKDD